MGDEIARSRGTHAVGFIGSTGTGRIVAAAAAGKALVLEMGGNGPVVVMDDADLDLAVEATVAACFLCAGQSCTAGERILVHRAVQDDFVDRLARRVTKEILLGDPFDDATTMGPLNNAGVAEKMDEHVGDALERGAEVVAGGARASGFPTDLYWQATVLAGVPGRRAAWPRRRRSARSRPSSRSARSTRRSSSPTPRPTGCWRRSSPATSAPACASPTRSSTGWVNVNDSSNYWESHLPFGGRSGTDSGIGRVGGTHVMQAFRSCRR